MWTKGIPQEPGCYWMRGKGREPQPVEVTDSWDGLGVFTPGHEDDMEPDLVAEMEFCPAVPPE